VTLKHLNINIKNMPMSYRLQIQDTNNQATITVPKSMWEAKNWEDGQELEWKINNQGNLELEEK